jgi:site-specific DNA-methyltransferase (adenine-specific)
MTCEVIHGKAEDVLRTLDDESAHACVTDPPSSIKFMGREWDTDKGGRDQWVTWLTGIMSEVYRTLKPGAFCFVWALPRRVHWAGWAVESAGFEVRDVFHAMFGTGMPKGFLKSDDWNGYGTGLKPVAEHWIIGRKPFTGSTASNLDKHGVGAFRINDCRIHMSQADRNFIENKCRPNSRGPTASPVDTVYGPNKTPAVNINPGGRYPPHIALVHSPDCVEVGTRSVKTGKAHRSKSGGVNFGSESRAKPAMNDMSYADENGNEVMPLWACVPGCPVRLVDVQSGTRKAGVAGRNFGTHGYGGMGGGYDEPWGGYNDEGGASRFWPTFAYVPKASSKERNAGCEGMDPRDWREGTKSSTPRSGQLYEHVGRKGKPRPNHHPTVKPVKLMRYIVRLCTPVGGLVIDPFNGSGTTGVACAAEGMNYIGIEGGDEDSEYFVEVSRRRIAAVERPRVLRVDPMDGFR